MDLVRGAEAAHKRTPRVNNVRLFRSKRHTHKWPKQRHVLMFCTGVVIGAFVWYLLVENAASPPSMFVPEQAILATRACNPRDALKAGGSTVNNSIQ